MAWNLSRTTRNALVLFSVRTAATQQKQPNTWPNVSAPHSPGNPTPRRMLRHKAMIQCARLAFGFGGIYDQDEAERIVEAPLSQPEKDITPPAAPVLPPYPAESFDKNIGTWEKLIKDGKKTAAEIINMVSSKAVLSEKQKAEINSIVNMTVEA